MNTTDQNPDPNQAAGQRSASQDTTGQDTTGQEATGQEATGLGSHAPDPHALRRPVDDRMLAGVAAGIARYLDVDVTAVRIVLAVLAVVGGAGVPFYLAAWLLIPEEGASQSIASEFIGSLQAR
ncbi:MAG TPA: PspC domain-containing protein [Streptosporangiaceae bacterium]|nr:PspC domain-containing protein [Streptosporangiaceae bacterium]